MTGGSELVPANMVYGSGFLRIVKTPCAELRVWEDSKSPLEKVVQQLCR